MISNKHASSSHFALVQTSISDCHRLILLFESHSYRIRNDDSTNNTAIHCNNLWPNQKIPPSIRECGVRLNKQANLHFLYTKSHLQRWVQNFICHILCPQSIMAEKNSFTWQIPILNRVVNGNNSIQISNTCHSTTFEMCFLNYDSSHIASHIFTI